MDFREDKKKKKEKKKRELVEVFFIGRGKEGKDGKAQVFSLWAYHKVFSSKWKEN